MKFAFQIEHEQELQSDVAAMLGQSVSVQQGAGYTTFVVEPEDPRSFWNRVQPQLGAIHDKMIVVCEGSHGWDDYRLLHSFMDEKLDTFDD